MRFRWLVLGVLGFSITIEASAASFDCAKAISRIDNTICASPKVSKLDDDLAVAYTAALRNSADQDGVKSAQRAWLKQTRNACQDEACFIAVYQQRIAALNASVPMGIPSREETESDDSNIPTEAELKAREQISTAAPGNTPATGSLASESPVGASAPASEAPATSATVAPTIQPSAPATSTEAKQSTSPSAEPKPQMAEKNPISPLSVVVALMALALLVAGLVWFIRKRLLPSIGKLSGQLVDTAKGMPALRSDKRAEFR